MTVLRVWMKPESYTYVAGMDGTDLPDVPHAVNVRVGQALVEVRGIETLWESQTPPMVPTWKHVHRRVIRARWVLGPGL